MAEDKQTLAVLANLAKAQFENADYARAITTLERAIRMQPESIPLRRDLARARFLWGQFSQSLDELRKIDAEQPSAASSYLMGLAALRLANNQQLPKSEPVAYLKRAAELDPAEPTIRYQWATALDSAGDVAAADEQFRKTAELDPLHGRAQLQLALRVRRSDPELYRKLMRDYERALEAKGGKVDDSTYEICRYTKFELPESGAAPAPAPETSANKFVMADVASAAGNDTEQLPPLAALAPLFLEENSRYQLVGVSPAGELVLFGFDGAGRAKVIARGKQLLGAVGHDAIMLVGNTVRDARSQTGADNVGEVHNGAAASEIEEDRPEIAIVTPARTWLVRYQPATGFTDLTAQSQLEKAAGTAARWIDMDHDGDIDLCVGSPGGFQVWRNNGDGTFADQTADFQLATAGPAIDFGSADFQGLNTRTDLVLAGREATSLWRSEMRGEFVKDAEAAGRWPAAERVIVDDFNNDSLPDVAFISPNVVTLAITKGTAQRVATGLEMVDAAVRLDDDNDGRLDVALFGRTGGQAKAVLLRNIGGRFAEEAQPLPVSATVRRGGVWALDVDGDCDTDLLFVDDLGQLRVLRNELANGNRQLKMSLYSNEWDPSSIGTRVEVRRDDFLAARWTAAELPIEIGVGQRRQVDSVQTLWTNGIAKNEISVDVDCRPLRITIIEFKRTTSCPFLYAWIDGRWQFVTDLLGIAPLNVAVARGVAMPPDSDEVAVLGPAERFADAEVAARLRVATELRELTILDQLRLLAVDHPAGVTIFSRDRVAPTAVEGKQILAGRDPVGLRSARGSDGVDRTSALQKEDRVYADPGRVIPAPVVGITEPLSLELEFNEPGDTSDLIMALTGWFRFGSSSTNIAASQRGDVQAIWPRLEVQNAAGQWQMVEEMFGLPAGNTKTIVCDLAGKLPAGARRFRLTSSFEVRWDHVALYHKVPADELRVSETGPSAAQLAWTGFHDFDDAPRDQPRRPDPTRASDSPPWFTAIEGWSTRYGDVRPLLEASDLKSALINAGDGVTVEFPAAGLPPRVPGTQRTLLLYSVGWVKSGDPNDTTPLTVEPFPGSNAAASDSASDWQRQYNTRWVPRNRFAPAAL